eukprot:gb/GEZN01004571.1/.p3 GENE.gb/GEZN01004571.1/~~gb/GEZN01004571.1/.p3  ORF type:complete len:104 (+),score=10.23 gb/GEZN01004571.1/:1457-1768(+)
MTKAVRVGINMTQNINFPDVRINETKQKQKDELSQGDDSSTAYKAPDSQSSGGETAKALDPTDEHAAAIWSFGLRYKCEWITNGESPTRVRYAWDQDFMLPGL